ncbi:MAG: hypothetical protein ACQEP5_01165 [Actinomycetota bacterium]
MKEYHKIFGLVLAAAAVGAVAGYGFFYIFREQSVTLIERFKILQTFFGIHEYETGMSMSYILLVVFFGNLVSTFGYFGLGWLKAAIPVGFITGFFLAVFLFTGIIRHGRSIPLDVYILVSVEALYRVLALSLGEYFVKNKHRKRMIIGSVVALICFLFVFGIIYEVYFIFR